MSEDPLVTLNAIAQAIFDKKGFNILALDVRGVSSLADFVIIAEGTVDKHVKAISLSIMDVLKARGISPLYKEGLTTGDWIVLDYMDIMVHLFGPGLRDKYLLEQLWRDGTIVDLQIDTGPKAIVLP
jgi:ribosome-associated protein